MYWKLIQVFDVLHQPAIDAIFKDHFIPSPYFGADAPGIAGAHGRYVPWARICDGLKVATIQWEWDVPADVPMENGNSPIENGDFPHGKWWFSHGKWWFSHGKWWFSHRKWWLGVTWSFLGALFDLISLTPHGLTCKANYGWQSMVKGARISKAYMLIVMFFMLLFNVSPLPLMFYAVSLLNSLGIIKIMVRFILETQKVDGFKFKVN